jgi:hypothetical protein
MMKNIIIFLSFAFLCIFGFVCLQGGAYAAATSTHYTIPVQIIDLGGAADMNSPSFEIVSKARETYRDFKTSESYSIEDRFMGIVVATGLEPTILRIVPNKGNNDRSYRVTIFGTKFADGTTVSLKAAGKTDIVGTGITVESSASLECDLDLKYAPTGKRDVVVTVPGKGAAILRNGFTVLSGPVDLGNLTCYPNPFNPNTEVCTIEYTLSKDATVNYYCFNQQGSVIWHKTCPAGDAGGSQGDNKVTWNGYSDFSEGVPTGVYVLIITARSGNRELARLKIAVLRQ